MISVCLAVLLVVVYLSVYPAFSAFPRYAILNVQSPKPVRELVLKIQYQLRGDVGDDAHKTRCSRSGDQCRSIWSGWTEE